MLKQVQWKIQGRKSGSLSSVHIYNTEDKNETLCGRLIGELHSSNQTVNDPQGKECKLCQKQREKIEQGKRLVVGDRVAFKKNALSDLPNKLREDTWKIILIFGFKDRATILSETYGEKRDVMLSELRKVNNDAMGDD